MPTAMYVESTLWRLDGQWLAVCHLVGGGDESQMTKGRDKIVPALWRQIQKGIWSDSSKGNLQRAAISEGTGNIIDNPAH